MKRTNSAEKNILDFSAATPTKPKRRNYKKELEQSLIEAAELKDQLLRIAAEFDNFRKRSQSEKKDLVSQANAGFIASLLPVMDDFDRFALFNNEGDIDSIRQGFDMVNKKLHTILQNQGLVHMECVGQPFDPEKHDALMQVEAKDYESDYVVEEHQKGYEFNGLVVRHAKVIVSK